jgi:hypothetical protein
MIFPTIKITKMTIFIKSTSLTLLSCILLCCSATKKHNSLEFKYDESLSKYSYLIFGTKIREELNRFYTFQGTCFFIRWEKQLYLITAKHVLSGNNTGDQKENNHPAIMEVCVKDSASLTKIPINTNAINDTLCCGLYKDYSDFCVIKVDPSTFSKVNSVENFIYAPFKKIDGIQFAGFTKINMERSEDAPITRFSVTSKGLKFFYKSFSFKSNSDSTYRTDTTNCYISSPKIPMDGTLQGTSGAPIFVKDHNSKKWRVLGLCGGEFKPDSTSIEAYMFAPNIEVILKKFSHN